MYTIKLKRVIVCGLLTVIVSQGLQGCSLFHDIWQQDDIAAYGESVFRRQNVITSQVMMLSESELSAASFQKLQQAESDMQKSCKLLNEYATREMDKATIDLLFQQQVRESIKGCDLSIQTMETVLTQLGIKK